MPIQLNPTAGAKVYVSAAAPATTNTAGYAALTWTQVKGFSNIGGIGNAQAVQSFSSLDEGIIKYRGEDDPGQMDVSMADLPADAGQVLLKAANAAGRGSAGEVISFKVEDGATKGTYARVLVAGWRRTYGGSNDVQMREATLPIIAGSIVEY